MKKMLFLLLFSISVLAQDKITAVKTGHFYASADAYAGFDAFGFQYFIKDNALIKANGKDKVEFKKIALGKITRADIGNPLLIVLFYEDFNSVVMLDSQLNEVRTVNFNQLAVPAPNSIIAHAVGLASQNRLWVYDASTRRIGLYDFTVTTYQPISTPLKEDIKYYQTDYNYFQWIDAKGNWYACDVFGKVTSLGKIPEYDSIALVSGQSFLFVKDDKLFYHNTKNNVTQIVSGLDNSLKNFYYQAQILAIFTSSGITNYKINLP
jgi:hypothetical protein